MDYKSAGVDIDAAEELVGWLRSQPEDAMHKDLKVEGIGGFASLFRIPKDVSNPCMVSCTDGVGTKLKIAFEFKKYRSVGQDLVAMCVNDLVTLGARPLFFLDYFSTGQLDLNITKEFLSGVIEACKESECSLVGGETAEMPGFYPKGEFDCAGFSVGVVDEKKVWTKNRVKAGDKVFAVKSSGFHSNGYSLLRKVFENSMSEYSETLAIPTRLYVKPVLKLIQNQTEIHSAAHITGGGMENVARVIPDGLSWEVPQFEMPPIYQEIKKRTGISNRELLRTFNCGVGFVLIAPKESRSSILEAFGDCQDFGEIKTGPEKFQWGSW